MEGKGSSPKKAMVLMALCAIMWSIGGLFIKLIPWHPLVIAGLRSLIAAGIFAVYMLSLHYKFILTKGTAFCGVMLMATLILFVTANKLTTSANAIILQSTAPIHIVLFSSIFLKSRYSRRDYLVIAICLGGIALFFLDQLTPGGLLGNLIALVSGVTMGGMFVLSSVLSDDQSSMSALLLGHLFTAAVGLCAIPFSPMEMTGVSISSILVLGVLQLGVPYILYGIAVQRCPPLYCSLIGMLEPLFNPVWVFLVVREKPGVFALIGGIIVMVTVALWCAAGAKTAQSQEVRP